MSPAHRHPPYSLLAAAIIAACLSLYLVGAARVNLWDRDEAWYAQTSRHMLESGNWVVPYFLGEPRYAKPIFIYWCQAASMALLGRFSLEAAARLPSALAMAGTLCMLAIVIGRAFSARRAMYTVLVFGTSGMIIMSAKMCLTDSVMLLFLTAAQLCLFAIYRQAVRRPSLPTSRRLPLLLWLAVGMAALTKGPIVLVVLFSTMLILAVLDVGWKRRFSAAAWRGAIRWWPRIRPLLGLGIALAIVAPWLIAAYLREPAFLQRMLQEPVRHASSNQDGQWQYPGYYLIAIWPTFYPWSLLLVTALVLGWKHRRTPAIRFALATIIGNWIYAEIMVTKLPHYMMPSFAALAFLTSAAILRCLRGQYDDLVRSMAVWAAGAWAVMSLGLAVVPWFFAFWFEIPRGAALAFTAAGVLYAATVFILFARRQLAPAVAVMGGGMPILLAILFGFYLPNAEFLRLPSRVATRLIALGITGENQAIMTGYAEPSLGFYQGGTIRPHYKGYLAAEPPERWPRWVITSAKVYNRLPPDRRARLREVERLHGLNYNEGDNLVDVLICEKIAP